MIGERVSLTSDEAVYWDGVASSQYPRRPGEDFKQRSRMRDRRWVQQMAEQAFVRFFPLAMRSWQSQYEVNGIMARVELIDSVLRPFSPKLVLPQKVKFQQMAVVRRVTSLEWEFAGWFDRSMATESHKHKWRKGLWIPMKDLIEFSELLSLEPVASGS